jgi:PPM family protein phosphatase
VNSGSKRGLRWAAVTDTGRVRSANEDAFVANDRMFVVADGMGGHLAGEVASEMAVTALLEALGPNRNSRQAVDTSLVVSAVHRANVDILNASRASADRHGMGTTLTALALIDSGPGTRLALVNVGDSRAYVMRRGRLQQLSIDHSYVQELIDTGQLSRADARFHPQRNIVTRALGIEPNVRIDAWTLPIVQGDRFLLCSDGLVDEVLDETIGELLDRIADPSEAAMELVATANRHGGRDNVTVLIVDVVDGEPPIDPTLDIELEPHWAEGESEIDSWSDDPTPESPWAQPAGADVAQGHPGPISDLDQRDITRTMALPVMPRRGKPVDDRPAARNQRPSSVRSGNRRVAESSDDDLLDDGTADHGIDATRPSGHRLPAGRRPLITWRTLGFLVALAAIVVVAVVALAASARSGYFVGFENDRVAIYKGKDGGSLGFDPTVVEAVGPSRAELTSEQIAAIDAHPTFDGLAKARIYVGTLNLPEAPPLTLPQPTAAPNTSIDPSLVASSTPPPSSLPASTP